MTVFPFVVGRGIWHRNPIPPGFGIALAIALAGLGLLIPAPIVFPWRAAVTATLATVAVIAGIIVLAAGRRWTAALLAASAMVAIWQGTRPWAARAEVLARASPDDINVARHFVVGYSDPAVARELVRDGHVGGIFLTRRNVAGRTTAAIAAEVASLQAIRRGAGLPPLIVAADQEGGPVSHLSPPLPTPPALSSFATLPPEDRRQAARRLGVEQGAALRTIGVTMDLAPVADLTPAGPPGLLDRNTRIATRSISDDPAIVADVAAGFSEGLLAARVVPTAKHFPGLGRVAADTHLFSASLDVSDQNLASADWIPFRAVLKIPGAAIMLSHVALSGVDPGVAASRSRKIVAGILRDEWNFDGIAITDDLSMGAVEHAGLCRAVEGALNAGIDLVLVSWDTDKVYPALRCSLDALDAGRLDRATLRDSARRLDRLAARAQAQ